MLLFEAYSCEQFGSLTVQFTLTQRRASHDISTAYLDQVCKVLHGHRQTEQSIVRQIQPCQSCKLAELSWQRTDVVTFQDQDFQRLHVHKERRWDGGELVVSQIQLTQTTRLHRNASF
jgi:hypothetical protein